MKSQRPHKSLLVWQESIQLVVNVYEITQGLPAEEKFGITSQMRRAVVSIPANIAEGAARKGNKEFIHFLHIASESLSELDTFNEILLKLNYIDNKTYKEIESQIDKVGVLLSGLITKRNSINIQSLFGWLFAPLIS